MILEQAINVIEDAANHPPQSQLLNLRFLNEALEEAVLIDQKEFIVRFLKDPKLLKLLSKMSLCNLEGQDPFYSNIFETCPAELRTPFPGKEYCFFFFKEMMKAMHGWK